MKTLKVIDSHTGGEPTRLIVDGLPELPGADLAEKRDSFRAKFDHFRSGVVNEPRGSDVIVGGALVPPTDPTCSAGVIFFNNVGYLNMCGHGTIGLLVTLRHLGKIEPGTHRIETPVGVVTGTLTEDNRVTLENVESYRETKGLVVPVDGLGEICGDVAWGGNWFFLTQSPGLQIEVANAEKLTLAATAIRRAVNAVGEESPHAAEVDHVELFSSPKDPTNDSRNFVLCPGGAYDRSPCGTGTSAKVACLHADGSLPAGQVWRQESITGSVFEASVSAAGERVIPTIRGDAHVTAETTLIFDERDPFCWGIG